MDGPAIHTRTSLDELIGTIVGNRFRVESVLGVGAMGVVFRARLVGADSASKPVALKVVLPDPKHQRTVPRLLRGARLAAQVKHPHVVATLGHGRVGPEQSGYFVAMELIEGVSLGRLIDAELELGAICTLMSQVLDALAHMHAHGILHRDIKPDNVLVSRDESGQLSCKISDFGIAAEVMASNDANLTQPGVIIGTPMYMAPEQMEGKGLDTPAIDLYSVGVMLYELLGGKPPFSGHSMSSLLTKISSPAPPLVAREGLVLPPGLADVVMRLVARLPEDRYLLAADARHALEPFCGPAMLSDQHWQELLWEPRSWESVDLPAGWTQGRAILAAGKGQGPESAQTTRNAPTTQSGQISVAAAAGRLPLIDRDDLLQTIDDIAGDAEQGQGRAVLLSASVGMGKTAVMNEAAARLAASGRFLVVRVVFPPIGATIGGLRQALDSALGTTGRSVLHVRQVVKELLRRHGEDDAQELRELVGFLRPAGTESSEQGHIFALMYRCLRRFSQSRPVLLTIDDLHRGGPDAAAFLEYLLFQSGLEPLPLLVLATVTDDWRCEPMPAMLERLSRLEGSMLRTLRIPPVSEDALVSALIAHLGMGQTQARSIARRSAGNPLFALHLARATRSSHDSTDDLSSTTSERVPRVLHEILEMSMNKRLARTSEPQRYRALLEAVAILGAVVDLSLLEDFLADEVPSSQLDRDLDTCLDLGLLEWIETDGTELVALVPEVIRDVLLDGLNPRRARRMHRRAIEVRTAWAGSRVATEAGALGDHCEAAGQHAEAIDWWLRGQQHARAGGNIRRGLEWGLKALAALTPADPRFGTCALSLGRALLDTGDLARAEVVLRPVVDGADVDLALRAGDVLGDVYENMGVDDKWTALVEQLSSREAEASPDGRRFLYLARALWMNSHGRFLEGIADAERALDGALPGEQAQRAAQRLVFGYLCVGKLDEAQAMARRAVMEAGERLDLRARGLRALGTVFLYQGEIDLALQCQQEILELCQRSALLARLPIMRNELGDTLRVQGQLDQARLQYQAAERAAQELGLGSVVEMSRVRQLTCDLEQGRTTGVLECIEAGMARARQAGIPVAGMFYALLETWAHALEGRVDEAIAAYAHVADLQAAVIEPNFVRILETVAEALVRACERGGMTEARAQALRSMVEGASELARRFRDSGDAGHRQALLDRLPPRPAT